MLVDSIKDSFEESFLACSCRPIHRILSDNIFHSNVCPSKKEYFGYRDMTLTCGIM